MFGLQTSFVECCICFVTNTITLNVYADMLLLINDNKIDTCDVHLNLNYKPILKAGCVAFQYRL